MLTTVPVSLTPVAPVERIGSLRYLGGVALSSDNRFFGGLSSLRWENDHLYALSDQDGAWFSFMPREVDGRLIGATGLRFVRLRDADGRPLSGKRQSDAESMNLVAPRCHAGRCRATGVSIGLERDDRVLTYRLRDGMPHGRPHRLSGIDNWLARQPENLGVEAMAGDRSTTLIVSEGLKTTDGGASGLLFRPGLDGLDHPAVPPIEIAILAPGEERPSELAQIDDHRFVLLRRSWSEAAGFTVAIERLTLSDRAGRTVATTALLARLAPPFVTDNFEGATIRREGNRTFLYIVSDDNFDPHQRTMLLKFEIVA